MITPRNKLRWLITLSMMLGLLWPAAAASAAEPGGAKVLTPGPQPPTPTSTPTSTPVPTITPRPQTANVRISKQADRAEAQVGDEITFSILVANNGRLDAEDVVVTDRVAGYFDLIEARASRGTVSVSGQTITVALGTVARQEEVAILVRVRLNDQAPEELFNDVQLVTSSTTNNPDDDWASAQLRRIAAALQPTPTPTSPTALPTSTPPRPRGLPNTGAAQEPWLALVALGWCLIAASFYLRRRSSNR